MLMGNLLSVSVVVDDVMATNYSSGMFHLTVVPENFDPEEGSEADGEQSTGSRRQSVE